MNIARPVAILLAVVLLVVLLPAALLAATVRTITPYLEDHDIVGSELTWSTTSTVLGANSVLMSIPDRAITGWGQGLNVEVANMPGVSTGLGLSRYKGISFKANFSENPSGQPPANEPYPTQLAVSAPLYVSLILYDKTNKVWVSMIPTCEPYVCWGGTRMSFSAPDPGGWRTAVPVGGSNALWTAWSFDGIPWPGGWSAWPEVMTLSDWDAYIAANNLNVKVRKVNIQFGYMHPDFGTTWGRVYVDRLKTHGFILDFEP